MRFHGPQALNDTYKKQGGTSFKPNTFSYFFSVDAPFACPCPYVPIFRTLFQVRIPQPLCLPLLRKLPGMYQQFPFWNSTCVLPNPIL